MHRFFIPRLWIHGETVTIGGELAHQLRHVLRLRSGDCIVLLDNSGWEYEVELKRLTQGAIEGAVAGKNLSTGEPRTRITLYQALLKGKKFEFVLQKGTELGVAGFVPVVCERCVATAPDSDRLGRWQRIIQEAAEQSGRGKLPMLQPVVSFREALRSVSGPSLLPWEGEAGVGLRAALKDLLDTDPLINVFVGPEGGFSQGEVEFARGCGALPITLGRRVLRAETASLVAAAAILYECGDLGG